jgi:hypothetical protein
VETPRITRALLVALLASACAGQSPLPDEDRMQLERSLPGRTYYLRTAMYAGPFWSDRHRTLLSDVVPGEIVFVQSPTGDPIDPGPPTSIVPAGTRVRIVSLELPTGFNVTTRTMSSPRYNPWLVLEVDGLPRDPAPVIVLRRDLRSLEQVQQEIDRYLSPDDLKPVLDAFPEAVLRGIDEKQVLEGMPSQAVQMAWGYPEKKTMQPTPEGRKEDWVWPGGKRTATIVDGRLTAWTGETPHPGVKAPTP